MKVLVATRASQGTRTRDLWRGCVGGELVRPIEERCEKEERGCSCETAFLGVASEGLTTTATVQDRPGLTMHDYALALGASLTRREAGFIVVERYAEELARVAEGIPAGEVLERWDEWIQRRFDPDTGEPMPDVVALAAIDPDVLDDLELEAELEGLDDR